jgi:hypothetical protein
VSIRDVNDLPGPFSSWHHCGMGEQQQVAGAYCIGSSALESASAHHAVTRSWAVSVLRVGDAEEHCE